MIKISSLIVVYRKYDEERNSDGVGEGAQRPFVVVNERKKMGARSAGVRTRGQNPL